MVIIVAKIRTGINSRILKIDRRMTVDIAKTMTAMMRMTIFVWTYCPKPTVMAKKLLNQLNRFTINSMVG